MLHSTPCAFQTRPPISQRSAGVSQKESRLAKAPSGTPAQEQKGKPAAARTGNPQRQQGSHFSLKLTALGPTPLARSDSLLELIRHLIQCIHIRGKVHWTASAGIEMEEQEHQTNSYNKKNYRFRYAALRIHPIYGIT